LSFAAAGRARTLLFGVNNGRTKMKERHCALRLLGLVWLSVEREGGGGGGGGVVKNCQMPVAGEEEHMQRVSSQISRRVGVKVMLPEAEMVDTPHC
jgi:hypothetical protein